MAATAATATAAASVTLRSPKNPGSRRFPKHLGTVQRAGEPAGPQRPWMEGGLTAARRRRSRPHSPPETLLAWSPASDWDSRGVDEPTPQPRAPRCSESTGAQLGAAPDAARLNLRQMGQLKGSTPPYPEHPAPTTLAEGHEDPRAPPGPSTTAMVNLGQIDSLIPHQRSSRSVQVPAPRPRFPNQGNSRQSPSHSPYRARGSRRFPGPPKAELSQARTDGGDCTTRTTT
eukprot:3327150-Pyramimonas_sp.AAC.1